MGKELNARIIENNNNEDKRFQVLDDMLMSYEEETGIISFIEKHKKASDDEKMKTVKSAQTNAEIKKLDEEFEIEMQIINKFKNRTTIKVM